MLVENETGVQSADDCIDISDHCSPRLCGLWSQALIKCKRTCHPQCTIRCLRNGQCQTTRSTTTLVQTTSTTSTVIYTTTTSTTSTTTTQTSTTEVKTSEDTRCKCFEPKSGRSFVENSIYKHPTRPGCVTTYICATHCAKIYHLPETCSKITTTTATTTRATTKSTIGTTTRATTRSTTTTRRTTTEETLPTIRPVTESLEDIVSPYVPTACSWKGNTIQIGLYKMVNNCEYVQCLRDFILNKPFLHYKAGFQIF